jgi:hypothetical protein
MKSTESLGNIKSKSGCKEIAHPPEKYEHFNSFLNFQTQQTMHGLKFYMFKWNCNLFLNEQVVLTDREEKLTAALGCVTEIIISISKETGVLLYLKHFRKGKALYKKTTAYKS